ncbi:Re/Si-specific NAD(P)(+) transhydrogenase subunit alpha [Myceligenerans pegani]|uniref:proton-translocating NAD(P)(+) transhydrogenase n=1 Tax=Myceligenerans pegani TaxID=2776917 RepID=A0ABR9N2V9_9MICO|nr:Re/Si-specific NAD(P)(+) transhydrogenase subunit alpha [Myceligenerans sp. TRM 65318]MBE1877690.1 Re/Si-specific NAD(P)(+) transhydrogenase subunit alpha [Myceligenerans sp. TRM 65318]MBE3019961.1 Re/Si-specific NAD(P)(+) transhydrogenase subunit alpha [Myceligenerans sp. TRM 65318]
MQIGIPDDAGPLVAATPSAVERLGALGYDVVVTEGAGAAAGLPDDDYRAAGALVVSDPAVAWESDVVVCTVVPDDVTELMRPGSTLVARLAPAAHPDRVRALAERGITALALDAVPRISRAQSLDVLSVLSNVAGYRAVVEAAVEYSGMFGGQVTAAGSTRPATVFVIGAGVAGLAALGAATALGARVRAFDVRPEVAEQIESMGAEFVSEPEAQQQVSADGYAAPLTEDQLAAALRLYTREAAAADIVITTALVRGTAPTTLTAEAVAAMRPGSVIVDLAAPGGGNCELTVPGERVVSPGGVVVLGWTDLPARMPRHTSELHGTAVANLLTLLTPGKDGEVRLDLDDVVQRGITVARGGEVLWPPPAVQVSAAPAAPAARAADGTDGTTTAVGPETPARRRPTWLTGALAVAAAVLAGLVVAASPAETVGHFTVLALAIVVGFYVIRSVTHALHTPLMSQTNAVSGIILVGALLQIGSSSLLVTVLATIAAAVASINVFGGFLVTRRMLRMFRKADETPAEGSAR